MCVMRDVVDKRSNILNLGVDQGKVSKPSKELT